MTDTLGTKLLALKARSGLSLRQIAHAAGYKGESSIQRYFNADYDAEFLPPGLANKLKTALLGFGDIERVDIEKLAEGGFYLQRKLPYHDYKRTIPSIIKCFSSMALAGEEDSIEVFSVINDVVDTFIKPKSLMNREIEAVYMDTIAMMPRYNPGDVIFYARLVAPALGDDIIIFFRGEGVRAQAAAVGRYVGRTRIGIEVETLNPKRVVFVPHSEIDEVARIMTVRDFLEKGEIPSVANEPGLQA